MANFVQWQRTERQRFKQGHSAGHHRGAELLWEAAWEGCSGSVYARQPSRFAPALAQAPSGAHPPAKFFNSAFTAASLRFRTSIKLRRADNTVVCALSTLR